MIKAQMASKISKQIKRELGVNENTLSPTLIAGMTSISASNLKVWLKLAEYHEKKES